MLDEQVDCAASIRLTPYLLFNGECGDAMTFYQSCIGGKLTILKVGDSPVREQFGPSQQSNVLNAHLVLDGFDLSASDWLNLTDEPAPGNTCCLFLRSTSRNLAKYNFNKLSAGANVTNPLSPTFFGVYGALCDRFGVRWMFQST